MFSEADIALASDVLSRAHKAGIMLAIAESCTGGLVSACLTAVPGASEVLDRGFVTYTNDSKTEMLGVPADLIRSYGAVSEAVACAMAEGALARSRAEASIAITGIAGPGGGSADKPVGLVWIAGARTGRKTIAEKHLFGDIGRSQVREKSLEAALRVLERLI
ncbi:MAG: CinA family protein [Alphaproteobacteria bacterium]|nr:MAG: CinA family protein [Alphaproteobacteria bacterium]